MNQPIKIPLLYIDDEQVNLLAFRANFRREYEVYTATSGEKGKELIEEHNIKIVVADQRMPKMTGVQFFEWIQIDHPDTIRILLTGFTDVSAVIDAINKGNIYSYINKPWHEDELNQTFKKALEQSKKNAYFKNLEIKYNQIFKQSSDAIISINKKGTVVSANNAAKELFNYSLKEITSIEINQLFEGLNSPTDLLNASGSENQIAYDQFRKSFTCSIFVQLIDTDEHSEEFIQVILKRS